MAISKEIRTQIASIKNTQKITSAMKMVAASKMKKAQMRMESSRPYTDKIISIINHLSFAHSEFKHNYMQKRDVKKIGYIVISSDRGLCGGLNSNLFRKLLVKLAEDSKNNITTSSCAIGKKSLSFLKSVKMDILATTTDIGDKPSLDNIIGTVTAILDKFDNGDIDMLYVVYNKYINTITQNPVIEQLLPIESRSLTEKDSRGYHWDYIYEPDAKMVLNDLLVRFVESLVYQGVIENIACEQSARMVAMQSATDNAGDMVKNLQLVYNKARQAAITQEISEIVSGAAAV